MSRSRLGKILSYVLVSLIVVFVVRSLLSDTSSLQRAVDHWHILPFIGAAVLFAAVNVAYGIAWRSIVHRLHGAAAIPLFSAVQIYIVAQFARYVPGKFFDIVSLVALGRRYGTPGQVLAVSAAYELILTAVTVFLVPAVFLGAAVFDGLGHWYVPALIVACAVAMLHPRVIGSLFRFAQRIGRLDQKVQPIFISYRGLMELTLIYAGIMIVNGFGFFLFMRAFTPVSSSEFVPIVGYYMLANGLGMIAIFAPSGLGVREGFLAYFLQRFVPVAVSAFLSLMVRIVMIAVEILLLLIIWVWGRGKFGRRLPSPESA